MEENISALGITSWFKSGMEAFARSGQDPSRVVTPMVFFEGTHICMCGVLVYSVVWLSVG